MHVPFQKAYKAILFFLVGMSLLLATHLGEFWPFSIYPMFSQAGKTWQRALVIQTDQLNEAKWDTLQSVESLPGTVLALKKYDIPQNDFANFLHKTPVWTHKKQRALHHIFSEVDEGKLLIYRVVGSLNTQNEVIYEFIPMMKIKEDGWQMNPALRIDSN